MTQTRLTILYSYQSDNSVTLAEAINNYRDVLEGAIALLYSPTVCHFLRLTKQEFYNSSGKIDNLNDVFEARVFTEHCELRWLNQDSGQGKMVLISESEQLLKSFKPLELKECEALTQKYLLWGEPAKNQPQTPGWQRLAEARIGKLDIPFDRELKQKQRVYLKTYEYLGKVDNYGNVSVIEERLVKLEV